MLKEYLATEYVKLVEQYYPQTGKILHYCHVRVLECYIKRLQRTSYYLGIYYPKEKFLELQNQESTLKKIAENMGLFQVVFVNVDRIIRDPMSQLKSENPRLWLELYWLSTQFYAE